MATYSGIYEIINNVTQKRYIGLSKNVEKRKHRHLHMLRRNMHPNMYLQNAWDKYGEVNFSFNVLERCTQDCLFLREDYWVRVLKTLDRYYGYNLKETDPNGKSIMSDEHKLKLVNSRKTIDFKTLHTKNKGKKVMNIITNQVYNSLTEAADVIGMHKGALSRVLSGVRKNNTNLIYLN